MRLLIGLSLLICYFFANSQSRNNSIEGFSSNIIFKIDTLFFSTEASTYQYNKEKFLFFKTQNFHDLAEITYIPNTDSLIESVKIQPSAFFNIIDTLIHINGTFFKGKIQFIDLENAKYPTAIFEVRLKNGQKFNQELKLYPYFDTYISYDTDPIDLFLDEEKVIELPCLNVYNIKMDNDFGDIQDYDVKLAPSINALKFNIKPKVLGSKTITIKLKTIKPFINANGEISFDLNPIKIKFNVKPNRVDYINPEKFTIYFNPDFKSAEDIQFDYNRNMGLRKTYRIEDSPENGGNLIAEIFTLSQVGNSNKILCKLRTFALHRVGEGYLYVKDGDKTRFLSNFNIIEKPRIDDISIQHDGEEFTNNLNVLPGERFEVRVKGTGLQQSSLQFEGIENVYRDSSRLSDEVAFFIVKVPINISKRKINIFMNRVSTQYSLNVREFQNPKDFDYLLVNYDGQKNIPVSSDHFNKPIFYEGNIKDINILFDPSKIDVGNQLYGKQYFDIEVKVFNNKNELLEIQNVNNLCVAPNEASVRGAFYDNKDARKQPISLNDYLFRKTYSYDPFTQVYITIKHNEAKHGPNGVTRKLKLILKRKYAFDVEVSFPAGLLTYKFTSDSLTKGIGNFNGISIAFIAQFRFYEENNVNKFKPWSIGAGFIAIDAFNFNPSNRNRDLGIVALGTITPMQRSKLSFPLYAGGGYLVNQNAWFVLFGPGIRFSF